MLFMVKICKLCVFNLIWFFLVKIGSFVLVLFLLIMLVIIVVCDVNFIEIKGYIVWWILWWCVEILLLLLGII